MPDTKNFFVSYICITHLCVTDMQNAGRLEGLFLVQFLHVNLNSFVKT